MAYEFRLPDLGEGMEEATIVKWLVKPGDIVKKDQPIVEVETDKAIVDIPSPYEGRILSLNFKEGDVAKVGSVLITIEDVSKKEEERGVKDKIEATSQRSTDVLATPRIKSLARELGVDLKLVKGSGSHGEIVEQDVRAAAAEKKDMVHQAEEHVVHAARIEAVPMARELAKKLDIDLTKIIGTGPNGVITVKDVENTAKRLESNVRELQVQKEERVKVSGIRKSIIDKLTKSNTLAVQTTAMDNIDVTRLVEIREKEKVKAEDRNVHLTYLPFIVKACVIALKNNPWLNATFDDERNEFVLKKYYNIGIAVDTDYGLVVPVLKDVELKSIMDIAKEIEALAEKARQKKLGLNDISDGTFSITNWGSIGGSFGTPILNYPQCAILGIGRIEKKPVVINDQIEIRAILPISLTFDHRIVDGAQAARFIVDLKKHLEDPALLLVDIV